tara:strand:+ start:926 stop:1555 length:630 start_codon:yes stop_codon:yes gene_type:complete
MEIRVLDIIQWTMILIAFVAAIVKRKNFGPARQYFEWYMLFVICVQICSELLYAYGSDEYGNSIIYNIYDVVTYLFFLRWFYHIVPYKKLVLISTLVYGIAFVTSLFVDDYIVDFSRINTYTGTLVILILTNAYYVSLLKREEIVSFTRLPSFWIASGLLIFNIGYLPLTLLILSKSTFILFDLSIVTTLLTVVLYGCFIKAFLCPKEI